MSYRKVLENLRNLEDKRLIGGVIWDDMPNCGCVLGATLPGLKERYEKESKTSFIEHHYNNGFNNLEGMTLSEATFLERRNDWFEDRLYRDNVPSKERETKLYQMVLEWLEQEVVRESNVVQ